MKTPILTASNKKSTPSPILPDHFFSLPHPRASPRVNKVRHVLNIDAASSTSLKDTPNSETPRHQLFDRLGILGSALCLLHCISSPLLIGLFGLSSLSFLHADWIHKGLASLLIPIAALAIWPGVQRHGNRFVLLIALLGVLFLLTSALHLEDLVSHRGELALTITGSLLLIGAHIMNWRLSRAITWCNPRSSSR